MSINYGPYQGYYDAGSLMTDVRGVAYEVYESFATGHIESWDLILTSIDGMRAVGIGVATFEVPMAYSYFVLFNLGSSETIAPRYLISSKGFCGSMNVAAYPDGVLTMTYDEWMTFWDLYWIPFIAQIFETWCVAVTFEPAQASSEPVPTLVWQNMVGIPVSSGAESMMSTEFLQISLYDPELEVYYSQFFATLSDPKVESSVTIGLAPVVKQLEDIALKGYDLSINHGQSIFSVNGKVITG